MNSFSFHRSAFNLFSYSRGHQSSFGIALNEFLSPEITLVCQIGCCLSKRGLRVRVVQFLFNYFPISPSTCLEGKRLTMKLLNEELFLSEFFALYLLFFPLLGTNDGIKTFCKLSVELLDLFVKSMGDILSFLEGLCCLLLSVFGLVGGMAHLCIGYLMVVEHALCNIHVRRVTHVLILKSHDGFLSNHLHLLFALQ